MPILLFIRAASCMLIMLGAELCAAQSVPAVYGDEYVSIHAGVAETGLRPIHVGDAISFVVQLEFDSAQVRVEALDSEFFQRAFAGLSSIRLYAPPVVTQADDNDGHVLIHASWAFQVLGCPEDLHYCPGDKNYELPLISLSYQLIDESGEGVNDKSVRFRPWPGRIAVASALADPNGQAGEFTTYFPGGAHPEALTVTDRQGTGMLAMFAGILLIVAGFSNRPSQSRPQQHSTEPQSPASRWQHALSRLQNDPMPDEQWADLLRRCASWYCLDELGRNPHRQRATNFDQFFADVLSEESIEAERRSDFLARFLELTGGDR